MRPQPRQVATLAAVIGAVALAACEKAPEDVANGDDPIAALRVQAVSTRYTQRYWTAQMDSPDSGRQKLWAQAYALCNDNKDLAANGDRPNCREVLTTKALHLHSDPTAGNKSY